MKTLSNVELVIETKRAVGRERQATLAVLDFLHEIYSRSVHLQRGYSSLHEFCVTELKMSDGGAHRRIQSMRLAKDLPEARQALAEGALSLSAATSLQNYFRKNKKTLSAEDKHKLLREVQGKSKSEYDRILNPEQKGEVVRFLADEETLQLLKRLSELTAIGEKDTATLIKRVSMIALRALDPLATKSKAKSCTAESSPLDGSPIQKNPLESIPASPKKPGAQKTFVSRYIAVAVVRGVWVRDSGQCAYIDPISKRRCTSRHGLQLDHVIPFACGGTSTLDNLRLACSGHNTLTAKQVYGKEKMSQYT